MANEKIMINGFALTSLEEIHAYNRVTNRCELYLTELKNAKISNTEDTVDITGKGDRVLKQIKKNKGVSVTGDSALISGDLMSAQTGSDVESDAPVVVRFPDVFEVTNTIKTDKKVTTTFKASGVTGAEIADVRVMSDNGGLIVNGWKQGAEAAENTYAYNPTSKELTLPTNAELEVGSKLVVFYDYKANGSKVVNKSDVFGKTLYTVIDCIGSDVCDNEYKCQFVVYRAQFSGEFEVDMGGDQTIQSFTAQSLVDTCAKSSTNGLWEFIVYKDEYTETA